MQSSVVLWLCGWSWLTHVMLRFFTRCYASAVYAVIVCLSVCSSACLSVCRYSIETAKHRITQTKPHYSPGILVFWCQRSRNLNGITPTEAPNAGGVSKIVYLRQIIRYNAKTVQDRISLYLSHIGSHRRSIEWLWCWWPPIHPNFCILIAFHTFIVHEFRDFTFGTQVDRS